MNYHSEFPDEFPTVNMCAAVFVNFNVGRSPHILLVILSLSESRDFTASRYERYYMTRKHNASCMLYVKCGNDREHDFFESNQNLLELIALAIIEGVQSKRVIRNTHHLDYWPDDLSLDIMEPISESYTRTCNTGVTTPHRRAKKDG